MATSDLATPPHRLTPDKRASKGADAKIIAEARAFFDEVEAAESADRDQARKDIKFSYGEQWPDAVYNDRQTEDRPALTLNKLGAFIRYICNQQRQQRPRLKVSPCGDGAQKKTADIIQGLLRHIEVQSHAESAYDIAFEYAVRGGLGYVRVLSDYEPNSFNQCLTVESIPNPFSVRFDPHSILPDGRDAMACIISSNISKTQFRSDYPGFDPDSWVTDGADTGAGWVEESTVRVAEYYVIRGKKQQLCLLSNGLPKWSDEISPIVLKASGLKVVGQRMAVRRQLHWYKLTAGAILEHLELPGRYIPVVPVVGNELYVENKRHRYGVVKDARDPQLMLNYWRSAETEHVALGPKNKWLMVAGQDEGLEGEWANANRSSNAVLHYKSVLDKAGNPAPAPQRSQPEAVPPGIVELANQADTDLTSVLGVIDPSQRIGGNQSGKSLAGERLQSQTSTFNFIDNLSRSIMHVGRILLDLIPHYYSEARVIRIIGGDGKPQQVKLNQPVDAQGNPLEVIYTGAGEFVTSADVDHVLNDVTTGLYEIDLDTGPGLDTKREQAVEQMTPLFAADPVLREKAGDIWFRNMDFPGADAIADRLAAGNPLANLEEMADVPPAVVAKMQALQQQLQQAQEQIKQQEQILKSRMDVEGMRQAGAVHREEIKAHASMLSDKLWSREEQNQVDSVERTKMFDIATRAQTAHGVQELKSFTDVLLDNNKTPAERATEAAAVDGFADETQAEAMQAAPQPETPPPLSAWRDEDEDQAEELPQ
jgi:hypothetical protein